ncbi:MAG: hypothetical protein LAO20_00355 [Acidobacteriia bacterium]|nr:hypothetical protein [Terriglobia bacterium]
MAGEVLAVQRALGNYAGAGQDAFFGRGMHDATGAGAPGLLSHELESIAQQETTSGTASGANALALETDKAGSVAATPAHAMELQRKEQKGSTGGKHRSFFGTIGHGIAAFARGVWSAIKWLGVQLFTKLLGIFERVVNWVRNLPARLGRLVMTIWEGVKSLKPWSLKWWKSLGHISTWGHFLEWLVTLVVEALDLGIAEIYETFMDLLKFNTRAMSAGEVALARSVFGDSIDYRLARIDERALLGPGLEAIKGKQNVQEYTSFHTINGWGGLEDNVLIHELVHVWQYQRVGAKYITQIAFAKPTHGDDTYDYGGVPGLQDAELKGGFSSFNREQQAQIVEDFFLIKHNRKPLFGAGTGADLPLYARLVKEVSTLTVSQLLATGS